MEIDTPRLPDDAGVFFHHPAEEATTWDEGASTSSWHPVPEESVPEDTTPIYIQEDYQQAFGLDPTDTTER
eukprot:6275762-Prorocentrum_lima.AAC.1